MELVEGETIAARLKSGPIPAKTALPYASQIVAALAEAHRNGIVHRDLKPANIMIAKSGIKILDFGLAKSGLDETMTSSHMILGTPAYMAPEQREGKPADARADIYSFGCVLYEMLTGARARSQRKPVPSRKLERIVSRCLEEDPGRRWQSAAEVQQELAAVSPVRRWTNLAAAAAATLVLAATGYFFLHVRPNSRRRIRLCWQILKIGRAIRSSIKRFDRGWPCNSNNPRSSLSSQTRASSRHCIS
jgi:serine/threonine protein kinase